MEIVFGSFTRLQPGPGSDPPYQHLQYAIRRVNSEHIDTLQSVDSQLGLTAAASRIDLKSFASGNELPALL
jgi:hypothetical protein